MAKTNRIAAVQRLQRLIEMALDEGVSYTDTIEVSVGDRPGYGQRLVVEFDHGPKFILPPLMPPVGVIESMAKTMVPDRSPFYA